MATPRQVLFVVGTRPNLVKTAPVIAEIAKYPDEFASVLVHTGQHYDDLMSRVFFDELGIPAPDCSLAVGSGTHAQQTARVMERLESVLLQAQPDLVIVPGDVNSTLAAALVAAKVHLPLAHLEAGLRSFDRTMPEEVNRVVTDQLSDLLFIHSPEAKDNLLAEGRNGAAIHFVGNTMIDTLAVMAPHIEAVCTQQQYGLEAKGYLVVTLHRPPLVDGPLIVDAVEHLRRLSETIPLVFPIHPRTQKALQHHGLREGTERLRFLRPLPYLEFLNLVSRSAGVLTDSGGIQEETTYLGVPCFTLRDNTERPITIEMGTNTLLGLAPARISGIPRLLEEVANRPSALPPLWDGQAAERLVEVLAGHIPDRSKPRITPVATPATSRQEVGKV